MAIHHPTPPLGGGERPRLAARHYSSMEQCSGGPVTQAIRAMRAADLVMGSAHIQNIPAWNNFETDADLRSSRPLSSTAVETLIEGLIDLFNAMDGDTAGAAA